MSELDEFLSWGAKIKPDEDRDSFGLTFTSFPYGSIAYWISEFRKARRTEQRNYG